MIWVLKGYSPLSFVSLFASVIHEVEEDCVEFNWKRNRLFNHTACLVLYQICMEVCACIFLCWISYTLFLQWFKNSWAVREIVTTSDLLLLWVCFSCYSMWDCSCCDFSVCLYSHECFVLLYFGLGFFFAYWWENKVVIWLYDSHRDTCIVYCRAQ